MLRPAHAARRIGRLHRYDHEIATVLEVSATRPPRQPSPGADRALWRALVALPDRTVRASLRYYDVQAFITDRKRCHLATSIRLSAEEGARLRQMLVELPGRRGFRCPPASSSPTRRQDLQTGRPAASKARTGFDLGDAPAEIAASLGGAERVSAPRPRRRSGFPSLGLVFLAAEATTTSAERESPLSSSRFPMAVRRCGRP